MEGCIADHLLLPRTSSKASLVSGRPLGVQRLRKLGEFGRWLLKVRRMVLEVVGRLPVLDGIIAGGKQLISRSGVFRYQGAGLANNEQSNSRL